MKHFLLLFFLICLSCGDVDPLPPTIEGEWQRFIPEHPPMLWSIRDGLIIQQVTAGDLPVSTVLIPYAERQDTLFLGGDLSTPPRQYITRLIGSDVLECTPCNPGPVITLGQKMYFERQ